MNLKLEDLITMEGDEVLVTNDLGASNSSWGGPALLVGAVLVVGAVAVAGYEMARTREKVSQEVLADLPSISTEQMAAELRTQPVIMEPVMHLDQIEHLLQESTIELAPNPATPHHKLVLKHYLRNGELVNVWEEEIDPWSGLMCWVETNVSMTPQRIKCHELARARAQGLDPDHPPIRRRKTERHTRVTLSNEKTTVEQPVPEQEALPASLADLQAQLNNPWKDAEPSGQLVAA